MVKLPMPYLRRLNDTVVKEFKEKDHMTRERGGKSVCTPESLMILAMEDRTNSI